MNFLDSLNEAVRPDVKPKPWFKTVTMELVTLETLKDVIDACIASGRYALDLETTGLDNRVFDGETVAKIVGFCLAPDPDHGYYIPIRHQKGEENNLPIHTVYNEIRRLAKSDSVAVFHNAKFDQEFLEYPGAGEGLGDWDQPKKWDDTQILGWLRNTRDKNLGLKYMSENELDMEMIELEDLYGKDHQGDLDFSLLDPSWEPCVWYACSDAICTLRLYNKIYPEVAAPDGRRARGQETPYGIEKLCLPATRWMERSRVYIHQPTVAELMQLGQVELFECLCDIYDFCNEKLAHKREDDFDEDRNSCGKTIEPGWFRLLRKSFVADNPDYDINKQIEDCRKTAKVRQMDVLDSKGHFILLDVPEGDPDHGFPQKYDILSRPQLGPLFEELQIPDLTRTAKSDQVQTTQDEIDRLNEKHGHKYPFLPKIKRLGELQKALGTYLISLHRDVGPDGTLRINYKQRGTDTGRFTTPSSRDPSRDGGTKFPMHGTPAGYDKSRPECLLRIREAVKARPGKIMAAIDFGGVELRIATIYSGEPRWLREYFRCSTCGHEFDKGDGTSTPPPPPAYCPKCGDDRIGDLHTLTGIAFYGEDKVGTKAWKQMRQGAKCVHPDTLIFSKDPSNLLTRIGDLKYGEEDTFHPQEGRVWNGSNFQDIEAAYNGGTKPLYHVVTHRGVVTCSENHRFKLLNGELKSLADGLAEGDDLVIPETPGITGRPYTPIKYKAHDDVPELTLHTSPLLAYFCGMFVGDGTKDGSRSVSITHGHVSKKDVMGVSYLEWQDRIVEVTEALGFRPVRRKQSVYLGSRNVMKYLQALDLFSMDGGRKLRVPPWILNAGRGACMQFVGGLIDSDGTIDKEDAEPSITTKDAVFGGQLMAMLRGLGFMPKMEACWNKLYERWYYRLHLRASEAWKIRSFLRHPGKKGRLRKTSSNGKAPENRVLAIIEAGELPCVDVSMRGGDHLYWCNGLITHNSTNFALAYGGGPSAIMRAIPGTSEQEASRHHRTFNDTYSTLKSWWDEVKQFGRKHGYVETLFKRHYPIPDILLPTKFGAVKKQLEEEYPDKLAKWEKKFNGAKTPRQKEKLLEIKPKPPNDAAIKKQMEMNRKFKAKAERNATNGPIQGLSADITKLAMALIYKECKKRGWLKKVYMIITIHDELVFEIDEDIAAEALELFQDLMCRNPTVMKMRWPVPLVTDCEIGYDWTVPYDIKDFKYKRVRPDGLQTDHNGKLFRNKETGDVVGKVWPKRLVELFGPVYGFAPVVDNPTPEVGKKLMGPEWEPLPLEAAPTEAPAPQSAPASPAPPAPEPAPQQASVAAPASPTPETAEGTPEAAPEAPAAPQSAPTAGPESISYLTPGEPFEYRLRELGIGVAEKLAHVIVSCRGRGSHPLRIVGPSGDVIWSNAGIVVSDVEFQTLAKYHGI